MGADIRLGPPGPDPTAGEIAAYCRRVPGWVVLPDGRIRATVADKLVCPLGVAVAGDMPRPRPFFQMPHFMDLIRASDDRPPFPWEVRAAFLTLVGGPVAP